MMSEAERLESSHYIMDNIFKLAKKEDDRDTAEFYLNACLLFFIQTMKENKLEIDAENKEAIINE